MAASVFITLGSNIQPDKNLPEAVRLLAREVTLIRVSRVYRTAPVGAPRQPGFLNAAILAGTGIPPYELKFKVLRPIEARMGRIRTSDKYAARTIDLDLALYGDVVLDDRAGGLTLPDPDILTRAHVALPLADLDPAFVHPVTRETLGEIAARFAESTGIELEALKLEI